MRTRGAATALTILSVLVLVGCAAPVPASTATPGEAAPGGAGSDAGNASGSDAADADLVYECNGRSVDATTFRAGIRADELTGDAADALAAVVDDIGDAAAPDDFDQWIIGAQSADSITLLRPHEIVDPDGADHDVIIVERVDEVPSTGEPGWMLTSSAACALALDSAPLTSADLALDPAALPDAADTALSLLVVERACNSGQDAAGRVEIISLEETAESVIVHVGVRPRADENAFTCQSNPPTPLRIELAEPLGERVIVDGSLVIPREVPALAYPTL